MPTLEREDFFCPLSLSEAVPTSSSEDHGRELAAPRRARATAAGRKWLRSCHSLPPQRAGFTHMIRSSNESVVKVGVFIVFTSPPCQSWTYV